jgi:exonuclease III
MTCIRGSSLKGGNVTLASWNVRGLNNQVKRARVFSYMKSIPADIIFLQETHISHSEQRRLRCNWISQVFQSTFSSSARVAAILFHKSAPFKHISTISDPIGRYLIVSGLLSSIHVTLLNVYGPNFDDPAFFAESLVFYQTL